MGWITRALVYRRDRADLESRLANAKADADYWRNEYGNKQAELVETKDQFELERNLDAATIKDLQENLAKANEKAASLESRLTSAKAVIEEETDKRLKAREEMKTARKFLQEFAEKIGPFTQSWI